MCLLCWFACKLIVLSSLSPQLQFHVSILRAFHPLLLHSLTRQHFLVSCVLCSPSRSTESVHVTTVTCFAVFTCITLFLCVLSVYPSLSLSLTPSPPQLSLHPLHHFHVPVVQSLQYWSLLLHLVGPVYVSVCCTLCECVVMDCYCHSVSLVPSHPSLSSSTVAVPTSTGPQSATPVSVSTTPPGELLSLLHSLSALCVVLFY